MKNFFLLFVFIIANLNILLSQQDNLIKIQEIRIEGRKHISLQTYQYYIQSKVGEIYDEEKLRNDFHRLWSTDLLLDLKIEVQDGENGKIVIFKVKEKPRIKEILYTGQKKLNISDITKNLEEKKINLKAEDPYEPNKVKEIEKAILQLLKDKGYRLAAVKSLVQALPNDYVKIEFNIDEGESLRIGDIKFDGNKSFSNKKLVKALKTFRKHNFLSWIFKKDKLSTEKLEESIENIKDFYFNHGFINIKVGEPVIETYETKSTFLRKKIKRLRIVYPIEEGEKYYFGELTISGNKSIGEEKLRKLMTFRKGQIFNRSKIKQFITDVQEAYGEKGYLFAMVQPIPNAMEEKRIVNVEFQITEDFPQYIRRIDFRGNTFTYDKVLRREMRLQEGDLLKIGLFRKSLERIYRTGFFDKIEPDVHRVEEEKDKVDIAISVNENKRNEIRLGGGYSQLEKFFGTLAFSTKNLFGTGKIFDIYLQNGTRTSLYKVAITDPYFLDYDYTLGIDISSSRLEYFIFDRHSVGGSIIFGFPIKEDFRSLIAYGYEVINITNVITQATQDQSLIDYYKNLFGAGNKRRESRLIPQVYRNTFNNPFDPTAGSNVSFSFGIAGGILGGDVNLIKPIFKLSHFIPLNRRPIVFAYNLELGYATGFSGKQLPVFERFFLGGEYSIRGYDVRTVGPIDPKISRFYSVGGNKYLQFNIEYQIPIAGPVKFAAFLDGGNAFASDEGINLRNLRYSTGAELRIMAPFFNAPIRFIYAINFNRGPIIVDRTNFRFAIGRTF